MAPRHLYRAHGLLLASELDLSGFAAPEGGSDPGSVQVTIRLGTVPAPGPGLQALAYGAAGPGRFILEAGLGGRFLVEEGRRITVELTERCEPALACLFLTGPGLAALLLQRGDLVLHGNALELAGRGIALCGPPASGKSATAAVLRERGARSLADDVVAVRFPDGPQVPPGCGPLKVRRRGLEAAGLAPEGWSPLRSDAERVARSFPLGGEPAPLEAVYLLGGPGLAPDPLRGRRILERSPLFVYRPELVAALGRSGDGMLALGALARRARFVELPEGSPARMARAVWDDLARAGPRV